MARTSQVPEPGSLNVDHVSHFVPDIDAAGAALEQLGFTLTPFSAQSHRLQPGGPLVPAGTGNRCVMLDSGYLEFLTPTGDTPVADQLRTAIRRYVGVHVIAFGTNAPEADHARLAREGFEPLAAVALQRPIAMERGEETARFTIVRVPPGTMAEGRIQFCQQHTPELLWQPRWTRHRNGAIGLTGVLVCVADPREGAERYSRFTGLPHAARGTSRQISTARGTLTIAPAEAIRRAFDVAVTDLPWIAGYVLETNDLARTRAVLQASGVGVKDLSRGGFVVSMPAVLGGVIVFQASGSGAASTEREHDPFR